MPAEVLTPACAPARIDFFIRVGGGGAGLKDDLDAELLADPDLRDNWDTVKEWTESSRYARKTKADAEDLYEAITDRKHGVLSWLKLRW